MIKKLVFSSLVCLATFLDAKDLSTETTHQVYRPVSSLFLNGKDTSPLLEIKPSYFRFSSKTMHKIYHRGGVQIQGSVTLPIRKWLSGYTSLGYMHSKGHSLSGNEPTSIWKVPFDLGLKAQRGFWQERVTGHMAIGPRYFCPSKKCFHLC